MFAGRLSRRFKRSYKIVNSVEETCREPEHLHQEDLERRLSNTVQPLKPHAGLFVNALKKLHAGDQLCWELRSGGELTENFPVAQTQPVLIMST